MRMFKIPNRFITDASLSFSARRMGAYFCACSNRLGMVRKSLAMLSGLSGLSPATVRSAVAELERAGYLTRQRTYRYDNQRAHMIYDRNLYQINKYQPGGFTLVPADLLRRKELTGGAFLLALYLCGQGAAQGRAFPSIRRIMDAIGGAKSTVCRALQQLRATSVFLVRHCIRHNRTFAANSYFFLRAVDRSPIVRAARQLYAFVRDKINAWGSPKISEPVIRLR